MEINPEENYLSDQGQAADSEPNLVISSLMARATVDDRLQAAEIVLGHYEGSQPVESDVRQRLLARLMVKSQLDDAWLQFADRQIVGILKLGDGWLGPRSKRIDRPCFRRLLAVLSAVELPTNPQPHFMGSGGGEGSVVAEWPFSSSEITLASEIDGAIVALVGSEPDTLFEAENIHAVPEDGLIALGAHLQRLSTA